MISITGQSSFLLFADETPLFSCHNDLGLAQSAVYKLFDTVCHWFKGNKLSLNKSKTQEIILSLIQKCPTFKSVKLLGFVLDYINYICTKLIVCYTC